MSELVRRESIWVRAWSRMLRLLVPTSIFATSGVAREPARGDYSALRSLSAMARFPWVRAAVLAKVDDLASLPLVAMQRGGAGTGAGRTVDDPALELLRSPSTRYTGRRLRRQLYLDFFLTGNAYVWVRRSRIDEVFLARLHPELVTPEVDDTGLVVSYEYRSGGSTIRINWRDMLHIAEVSWQDNANAALGEGPVRALHQGLVTEARAEQMAARAAEKGRPDFVLSPRSDAVGFSPESVRQLSESIEGKLRRGDAALVVSDGIEIERLSWTPRDLEFSALRQDTRAAVLAVLGVPPVRVGMPSANYGTSKQQMRAYWESLRGPARLFDDEFSRLSSGRDVRIEHDFTDVEALQVSRSERQQRTALWVELGATPARAAEYEGFADAPVPDERIDRKFSQRRPPREADEPQDQQGRAVDRIASYLAAAARRGMSDPEAEEADLAAVLVELGTSEEDAMRLAAEVVDVLVEALRQAAQQDVRVLRADLLPAFGQLHARQIARRMASGGAR